MAICPSPKTNLKAQARRFWEAAPADQRRPVCVSVVLHSAPWKDNIPHMGGKPNAEIFQKRPGQRVMVTLTGPTKTPLFLLNTGLQKPANTGPHNNCLLSECLLLD